MSGTQAEHTRRAPGKWWGLTVVCFGTMMSFLNITQTVSVLSPIQRDIGATSADLVWIASIYSMAVASLVLSAGTLGDLFGRRRIFALGSLILGAGSLVTFFSDSSALVIGSQALTGVGGAMVIPNALAIVTQSFTDPHERSGAVAIWATVSGVGLAIGPVIAGGLLKAFSWHSVYLVNVGIALVVLLLTRPLVTESRHPTRKLDPLGLVLAAVAIGALNYGVIEGGNDGYGATKIVVAFIVTVLAVLAFVAAERRAASPMLNLRLFRDPSFGVANVAAFIVQYAFVGTAIAEVLWFEQVRDTSILGTGLLLLALMGVYVLTSWPAGRVARRFGFKSTITFGLVLVAGGMAWVTQQTPATSNLLVAVMIGVVGVGCGFALPSTIAAAVVSVPHEEGGMASASVNTFRQIGSALGASITGTIITTGIASRLPGQLAERHVPAAARGPITDAVVQSQQPHGLPATLASAIHGAAGNAFADALHVAVLSVGIGTGVVLLAALVLLPGRARPAAAMAPAQASAPEPEVAVSAAAATSIEWKSAPEMLGADGPGQELLARAEAVISAAEQAASDAARRVEGRIDALRDELLRAADERSRRLRSGALSDAEAYAADLRRHQDELRTERERLAGELRAAVAEAALHTDRVAEIRNALWGVIAQSADPVPTAVGAGGPVSAS